MWIRTFILTVALCLFSVLAHSEESDYFKEQLEKAKAGDAEAQYWTGYHYYWGRDTLRNHQKALEWFQKSAEQGHSGAQYELGNMYHKGQGTPQNYQKALEWYQKAAEQGDAWAQNNLGSMYEDGQGVPQNYQRAYFWYSIAAANGHKNAPEWRDEVVEKMTPQQIAETQEKAQKWFDEHQKRKAPHE